MIKSKELKEEDINIVSGGDGGAKSTYWVYCRDCKCNRKARKICSQLTCLTCHGKNVEDAK